MNEKILEIVEKYLNKKAKSNGTCISITTEKIRKFKNLEEGIKDFMDCCYEYNSAIIKNDEYGVERLIVFSV